MSPCHDSGVGWCPPPTPRPAAGSKKRKAWYKEQVERTFWKACEGKGNTWWPEPTKPSGEGHRLDFTEWAISCHDSDQLALHVYLPCKIGTFTSTSSKTGTLSLRWPPRKQTLTVSRDLRSQVYTFPVPCKGIRASSEPIREVASCLCPNNYIYTMWPIPTVDSRPKLGLHIPSENMELGFSVVSLCCRFIKVFRARQPCDVQSGGRRASRGPWQTAKPWSLYSSLPRLTVWVSFLSL